MSENRVKKALLMLRNATPTEIKRYLDISAGREIDNWGEKSQLPLGKKRQTTISLKAVKNPLAALQQDGIVDNAHGKYSLHDRIRSDFRSFAPGFCDYALLCMLGRHRPLVTPVKDSLKIMVECYGIFVLYCMIQAARPVQGQMVRELKHKEKMKISTLSTSVSPLW